MTKFQILARFDDEDKGWFERGIEEAHNAEAAVKASYMKNSKGRILAMVAVPARSWKPTPIRTETVTKVVLGDEPQPERESPMREKSGQKAPALPPTVSDGEA
jgi:hypothetical protein